MVARILTAGLVLALLTQADETQAPPSDPPHERSPDPKSDPWVIGVDDELDIWVYEEPELNKSVRVRPDGRISMPYIDDVVVAGKTPEEVRDVLIQRLTGYVKSPRITVIGRPSSHPIGSGVTCTNCRTRFTYPSGCRRLIHASMRIR